MRRYVLAALIPRLLIIRGIALSRSKTSQFFVQYPVGKNSVFINQWLRHRFQNISMKKIALLFLLTFFLLTSCGKLDSIPYTPAQTPETWLQIQLLHRPHHLDALHRLCSRSESKRQSWIKKGCRSTTFDLQPLTIFTTPHSYAERDNARASRGFHVVSPSAAMRPFLPRGLKIYFWQSSSHPRHIQPADPAPREPRVRPRLRSRRGSGRYPQRF